jgi:hypothetical protein
VGHSAICALPQCSTYFHVLPRYRVERTSKPVAPHLGHVPVFPVGRKLRQNEAITSGTPSTPSGIAPVAAGASAAIAALSVV